MVSRPLGMSVVLVLVMVSSWMGSVPGAGAEGGAATPTLTPRVTPTLQVADLTPGNTTVGDTFLDSANATMNHGSEVRIKVRTISGVNYRPLIYFDLSTIPTNSTIRSATLYLYMDSYSHMPEQSPRISLYRAKQDWAEMEATWNQRTSSAPWSTPGCEGSADREASESAYRVVSTVSTWYDWDITSPAQAWVSSPSSNHGMLLASDNSREVRFYTSNDVDSRFHPHLRIEFVAGNPVPTATATPGATPIVTPAPVEIRGASQDTYVNKLDQSKNYENKPIVIRGAGEKRALLKFDVTQIPFTAQVTSATLRLAATNYDDGRTNLALNVEAYLVSRAWLANQATWLKATDADAWGQAGCSAIPADRAATMASSTVVQKISGTTIADMAYYDWNVTSIVQEWVRNSSSYAGLLLMAQDDNYREISFYDTAYSVVDYRPLLRVQWAPGATLTPSPALATTPTRSPASMWLPVAVRQPTPTPRPIEELRYDDGTYENMQEWRAAAVRFTVTERRQVLRLRYHLRGRSGPVQLVIYDANWSVLYRADASPGGSGHRWFDHDVGASIMVGPGDFYVGIVWPSAGDEPQLDEDATQPDVGRSYGDFFKPDPPFATLHDQGYDLDLMIRAVVQ